MEIIDSHHHFWQYDQSRHSWIDDTMKELRQDFMPRDLKKALDKSGVDGCVSVQADQTEEETRFLLELAQEYDFIKAVVGWLDIRAEDFEEQLQTYTRLEKLKGLRHVVQDEPDDEFMLRPDFLQGIDKLKEHELCFDILIFARHLPVAVTFVEKFPGQKFVLDHIGKPEIKAGEADAWEQGIRELARHPKMYCKLSGMVTEADWENWEPDDLKPYLDVVFDAIGPERLMFGSDWPVCRLAAEYNEVVLLIQEYIAGYRQEEQEMIMGGNAKAFYNF